MIEYRDKQASHYRIKGLKYKVPVSIDSKDEMQRFLFATEPNVNRIGFKDIILVGSESEIDTKILGINIWINFGSGISPKFVILESIGNKLGMDVRLRLNIWTVGHSYPKGIEEGHRIVKELLENI